MGEIRGEIQRLTEELIERQELDGTWRFCFENGISIDACTIILFRTLNNDKEDLIRQLHDRILAAQEPEGCWRWYHDDKEGHLSATVEAYYALLYSGYSKPEDEPIQRAKRYPGPGRHWARRKPAHQSHSGRHRTERLADLLIAHPHRNPAIA